MSRAAKCITTTIFKWVPPNNFHIMLYMLRNPHSTPEQTWLRLVQCTQTHSNCVQTSLWMNCNKQVEKVRSKQTWREVLKAVLNAGADLEHQTSQDSECHWVGPVCKGECPDLVTWPLSAWPCGSCACLLAWGCHKAAAGNPLLESKRRFLAVYCT